MTINNGKLFLKRVAEDKKLRESLESASSQKQISEILSSMDCDFTPEEIETAFNMMHVQCQTEDQAEQIKQLKLWWDLLMRYTPADV